VVNKYKRYGLPKELIPTQAIYAALRARDQAKVDDFMAP